MEPNKTIPDKVKEDMTAVLRCYVNLGVIGRAFDDAGVPRKYHLQWMSEYPEYKERFEECRDRFVDGLEVTAIDRAKEKSDALLRMMLEAHRSEVYGSKTEITHKGTQGQIQLVFAEGMLTDEEKKILKGEVTDAE